MITEGQLRSEAWRANNRGTIHGLGFGLALGSVLAWDYVVAEVPRWIPYAVFGIGMVLMNLSQYVLRPSWVRNKKKRLATHSEETSK